MAKHLVGPIKIHALIKIPLRITQKGVKKINSTAKVDLKEKIEAKEVVFHTPGDYFACTFLVGREIGNKPWPYYIAMCTMSHI